MANEALTLEGVSRKFSGRRALDPIDLEVRHGETLVVMGPSGAGKTTLLRLIAGLDLPESGRILLADKDVTHTPPHQRRVAMVRQRAALFPDRTVAQELAGVSERNRLVQRLHLGGLLHRRCETLSGGEQQRVSLARALGCQPAVCLLDEPSSSLDASQRAILLDLIREVQQEFCATLIYVTHDPAEAQLVADRIAVLNQGRLVQDASVNQLYEQPVTPVVANLLSLTGVNWLQGLVSQAADGTWLEIGQHRWLIPPRSWPIGAVQVGLRAEAIDVGNGEGSMLIVGRVREVRRHGSDWVIKISTDQLGAATTELVSHLRASNAPQSGSSVSISFSLDSLLGFAPDSGQNLGQLPREPNGSHSK